MGKYIIYDIDCKNIEEYLKKSDIEYKYNNFEEFLKDLVNNEIINFKG